MTNADTSRFLGGIYALPADALDKQPITARNILPGGLAQGRVRPHGLELLIEADGARWVYAIDRFGGGAQILMLALSGDGFSTRRQTPPRGDPALCNPNNIAAIDHDQLYVSNDRASCGTLGRMIENTLGLERSFIGYLQEGAYITVAEKLFYANGIEIDARDDGRLDLAVAETRRGSISFYPVESPATGRLGPRGQRVFIGAGPDNLTEGPDGAIYAAAIPHLFHYALFKAFGPRIARPDGDIARLWRDPETGAVQWARLARLSGNVLPGATVAAQIGRRLLAGSAYGEGIAICALAPTAAPS